MHSVLVWRGTPVPHPPHSGATACCGAKALVFISLPPSCQECFDEFGPEAPWCITLTASCPPVLRVTTLHWLVCAGNSDWTKLCDAVLFTLYCIMFRELLCWSRVCFVVLIHWHLNLCGDGNWPRAIYHFYLWTFFSTKCLWCFTVFIE